MPVASCALLLNLALGVTGACLLAVASGNATNATNATHSTNTSNATNATNATFLGDWFTAVGVFTGVFFFGFLINGAMYLARVDTLQKDTGPLNARAKLKDLEWEAKRKEKAEAKAKEIDIGGGFKPKGKLPNCPGEHGLTPCLADDVRCDACGADIPDNASIHSCEECDYDLCDGCGAGAAETRGAGAQA